MGLAPAPVGGQAKPGTLGPMDDGAEVAGPAYGPCRMDEEDGRRSQDGGTGSTGGGEALPGGTMLEHPVYVYWCSSCGRESEETDAGSEPSWRCSRCGGQVRRHQRVLELPDEDAGLLSLRELRAALADVAIGTDVSNSAVLLFEQGPDPGVADAHPELAAELAALHVPPTVQRALVAHGFVSIEQVVAAATATPDANALALQLGLSPAAEVLLRRLWHAAKDRPWQRQHEGSGRDEQGAKAQKERRSSLPLDEVAASDAEAVPDCPKRLRLPDSSDSEDMLAASDEESDSRPPLPWDSCMPAFEDGDAELCR